MSLVLRTLTPGDETAFRAGLREWAGEDLTWYSFAWKPDMTYAQMLEILDREHRGVGLAPGRVPHTMYYGFVDGTIVGRVSVRHVLNDMLTRRGGHVGYAVAPRFRGKGYATEMVRQVLPECDRLGIGDLLVTCGDGNVASWKVIEKFGGELEGTVWDEVDQEMIRRYWIPRRKKSVGPLDPHVT